VQTVDRWCMQLVILLLTLLAVLYHLCMRNDAALLHRVKDPVKQKFQDAKDWISDRFAA